jgi:hypothetical protein
MRYIGKVVGMVAAMILLGECSSALAATSCDAVRLSDNNPACAKVMSQDTNKSANTGLLTQVTGRSVPGATGSNAYGKPDSMNVHQRAMQVARCGRNCL